MVPDKILRKKKIKKIYFLIFDFTINNINNTRENKILLKLLKNLYIFYYLIFI